MNKGTLTIYKLATVNVVSDISVQRLKKKTGNMVSKEVKVNGELIPTKDTCVLRMEVKDQIGLLNFVIGKGNKALILGLKYMPCLWADTKSAHGREYNGHIVQSI